ncbi:autoinducer binding domain-containing protein [Jiella pelagia]|uniref:Autoinducer binding domain-containing protein n=1 Tax=Jiella pelagia TaxID=2986949 RepID=A0ABY7BYZ2_9HYPH|nr:autoinducer binding domain-containing protein [Jiella pelagia]WAP66800.1 autoinducer binding domain-containing protein [Jiella pelagia]
MAYRWSWPSTRERRVRNAPIKISAINSEECKHGALYGAGDPTKPGNRPDHSRVWKIEMNETADSRLFAALSEIQNATDGEAIAKLLDHLIAFYGLKSAAYLGTGIARAHDAEPYLAVTYSSEWVERYKDQRYAEIDPVIVMGLRRLLPLDWSEFGRLEGRQITLFGEAGEFGLGERGLSIPVHGRQGDRGLLSITSDLGEREWESEKRVYMRDFQVIATHIHDRVLRLEGLAPQPAHLSPRELECLEWIAQAVSLVVV